MGAKEVSLLINEIIFKSDTAERKRFFRAASFAHPAKMVLGLQIYLIEHYTKPGDTILDPMAGSGTILIACTLGRNVVLVELEEKFCKMQQDNWQKIRSLGPMLGYRMGEAVILQGDARNLEGVLADNILFSPPYAGTKQVIDPEFYAKALKDLEGRDIGQENAGLRTGENSENNISNLPYGEISAVISSPPYNEEPTCSENYKRIRSAIGRDITKPSQKYEKYGKADAIVTSPPYGEAQSGGGLAIKPHKDGHSISSYSPKYSGENQDNIGNLKSDNYLEAMLQVYRQCRVVLKPKGVMVLVTKNFIRDKKIIRLDLDTIKLCEQAGFKLKGRLARKITQQSFWRTIYYKKFPDVEKIEYEDVLIFQREQK